jgi:hypothetical protein
MCFCLLLNTFCQDGIDGGLSGIFFIQVHVFQMLFMAFKTECIYSGAFDSNEIFMRI